MPAPPLASGVWGGGGEMGGGMAGGETKQTAYTWGSSCGLVLGFVRPHIHVLPVYKLTALQTSI